MLKGAKRLYDMGLAVHWIKPKSKAPVKAGWSGPKRDDWDQLRKGYRPEYGLGVRMGQASNLGDGFLANIDVDIKSAEPRHRREALAFLKSRFKGLTQAPVVKTGYGLRYFVKTTEPVVSRKLCSSAETVVVYMPTAEANKQQIRAVAMGVITQAQLDDGYRVRPAWEVEFMSIGKQVVLPPSIHPDTGEPYRWLRPLNDTQTLPLVRDSGGGKGQIPPKDGKGAGGAVRGFRPVAVDLVGSALSDRVIEMLLTGKEVSDRSAACYSVALAMTRAKFTDLQIMSVLTDPDTFLGETAYDHRSTRDRAVAAAWVRDYCIRKARTETDAAKAFQEAAVVTLAPLTEKAAEAQKVELVGATDWRHQLTRSGAGDGPPKPSLENTVLVLTNAVAPDVIRRDTFASRDAYHRKTPWGGKRGAAITDDDVVKIKYWLAQKWRFEPSTGTVFDAITAIATQNAYHPIRDGLKALPAWDCVPRIDGWLKAHFKAKGPDEYLAQVFRKWLVASVARTFEPGLKFDWMPIFEGKQGTGKSTFGAILFGQSYFADWLPNLADKDAALGLQGKCCVEFGELDHLRRNEVETIKAFVTRQVDNVRPPYGRRSVELYRQCVFFGTTNKEFYLKDDTGNRRFNPVQVGRLNFDALYRDREQIWAEALFVYRCELESSLYLDNGAEKFAKQIQKEKVAPDETDFMVESIRKYFEAPPSGGVDPGKFKVVNLFDTMGPLGKWRETAINIQFAARALRVVGARRRKVKGLHYWEIAD